MLPVTVIDEKLPDERMDHDDPFHVQVVPVVAYTYVCPTVGLAGKFNAMVIIS